MASIGISMVAMISILRPIYSTLPQLTTCQDGSGRLSSFPLDPIMCFYPPFMYGSKTNTRTQALEEHSELHNCHPTPH